MLWLELRRPSLLLLPILTAVLAALASSPATALPVVDFSTYHGGCHAYQGFEDLAVDRAGNVWAAGYYPWDCDGGSTEVRLVQYSPDGERLALRSFGGHFDDEPKGIAIDAAGNLWVAGTTRSRAAQRPFPTVDPYQADNAGGADAFVTQLDPTGTTILYSTFLGGSGDDRATDVAVDAAGRIVVTGVTASTDFPTFAPTQPLPGGGEDAFVVIFEPDGSQLAFATYFGGSGDDAASRLALAGGGILIAGTTSSSDLPVAAPGPAQPFQPVYGGGTSDAFGARWSLDGRLDYSTYLGGSGLDRGESVAAAADGTALIAGTTDSPDFPTRDPLQDSLSYPPAPDAWVAQLDATGSALQVSTYLPTGVPAECPPPPVTTRIPCAAVAVGADGTILVTAAGAFLIELAPDRLAIFGYYGFGGSAIATTGDGAVYIAGRTGSKLFPTYRADDARKDFFEEEQAWLTRLRRGTTPDAQFEENDPRIAYRGDWSAEKWKAHSGQSALRASVAGARAVITFEGTGIRVRGRRDPAGGRVLVSVDQNPLLEDMTLDVHAPQAQPRSPLISITGLSQGTHTLEIEVTGTSTERSAGTFFWLDGFDVVGN